jgi:hypothetical protein
MQILDAKFKFCIEVWISAQKNDESSSIFRPVTYVKYVMAEPGQVQSVPVNVVLDERLVRGTLGGHEQSIDRHEHLRFGHGFISVFKRELSRFISKLSNTLRIPRLRRRTCTMQKCKEIYTNKTFVPDVCGWEFSCSCLTNRANPWKSLVIAFDSVSVAIPI